MCGSARFVHGFEHGRWSFQRKCDLAGWTGMMFELNGVCSNEMDFSFTENTATGHTPFWQEQIAFEASDNQLVIERTVTNISTLPLTLWSIREGILDNKGKIIISGVNEYFLRYAHSRNVRAEKYPLSRPEYPYWRPIPAEPMTFNFDEANHFPLLILGDEGMNTLLVEGELDQTTFVREWRLGLGGEAMGRLFPSIQAEIRHPLASPPVLAPGQSMLVSKTYYQILENTHLQEANTGYLHKLNERNVFRGGNTPLLHGSMYCTWNYGVFNHIDEASVLTRTCHIAKHIPECTHFMIDDGYQRDRGERYGALDGFYPDPENNFDPHKFPSGMSAIATQIEEKGLVPGIWFAPTVRLNSRLAQEHPDWLLTDVQGNPSLLGDCSYLDLSVLDARCFFVKVLDTLFLNWGYRAVKFDFMTHWFTLERARFRNGGSGPHWRDWVFREIRERIGDSGILLTCIAMSMGNPFVARYADAYRCGCDIHTCTWPEQLRAVSWSLPTILLPGRLNNLLNMDSAGFGSCSRAEQEVWLNWCFITQGMLEWGGKVEDFTEEELARLRRLLSQPDRGHRVHCLDEDAFTGRGYPKVLYVEYPEESITYQRGIRAHLAFFNWNDQPMAVSVPVEKLSAQVLTNFWTGDAHMIEDEIVVRKLQAHSSELWEIRKDQYGV